MATTQTDTRTHQLPLQSPQRNSRRNEIIAIALFALGLMLTLCLIFFNPNDPSLNSAGQDETQNLVGPVGAYVSDAMLQTVGLASYLLPLLLFLAAWRRFRTRRIHAPVTRIAGLLTLLISASAILALLRMPLLFDGRVSAGGFVGTFVASNLASALNNVGAFVLLLALASTGLLLATNFSFARAYERVVEAFGHPSAFLDSLSTRFQTWRTERRELAARRAEQRRAAQAAHEEIVAEEKRLRDKKTGAERVADFMRETETPVVSTTKTTTTTQSASASAAIQRSANVASDAGVSPQPALQDDPDEAFEELAGGNGSVQLSGDAPPRPNTQTNDGAFVRKPTVKTKDEDNNLSPGALVEEEDEEVAEMVASVSVVRTENPEEDTASKQKEDKATREARRAEKYAEAMSGYDMPSLDYLNAPPPRHEQADEELRNLATRVAEKCKEFNVTGKIEYICPGPVVTTYEFKPDPGVKYSRVTGLVDDLCLALKAESIRIDRVPGKAHVGIEVPNHQRDNIMLREVIESRHFKESTSKLTLALGKTIDGLNYVADLARMPHLLIAGATGTGKSVCLNSLVVSILYKARPDEVKFIMIDPKRLELGLYADIPHLATPIITDPKRAANALKWAVAQMEARYKELAKWGVRNIDGFNVEVMRRNMVEDFDDEGQPWKTLPYIVIIVDELADLMMTAGHDVEEAITRLAQMARAVGIHLVLATQRPSVDVITGLIKANFPSRIALRTSSKVDSRTIIDANGAEQLLGRGDMLFLPPGTSRLIRVHGAYLDESEVGRIVAHIKGQGEPLYDETITQSEEESGGANGAGGDHDELFEQALRICVEMKRASTSVLQRRLRIGYGRAAAILDAMEREGYIGQADGARPRPITGRAYETVTHWDDQLREEG
ncbi:MAG TPA: DNA translocase FtsK [Pyrinomonadaceae bacterium]|jgi:S-DNA-T family DNA segregation ATPase FtsK/SpoIIIE|nr:DNA translocase FtsK [Pyrinomonadaceae bacterium]